MTSRYGPEKSRRMLRCRTCKARFSERKGTPLFGARLAPEKIESVLEHVAEGCGVRQTGRLWVHASGRLRDSTRIDDPAAPTRTAFANRLATSRAEVHQ